MGAATLLGKRLRVLRATHDEKLKDMAPKLSMCSAHLSAIELGTRRPPADLASRVANAYDLNAADSTALTSLVRYQRRDMTPHCTTEEQVSLASIFGYQLPRLSSHQRQRIKTILLEETHRVERVRTPEDQIRKAH